MRVEIPASCFMVIWYRSAEIKRTALTSTRRSTTHFLHTSPPACLGLCVCVQSSVIAGRQSDPERSEDVAKAHNVLWKCRPLLICWVLVVCHCQQAPVLTSMHVHVLLTEEYIHKEENQNVSSRRQKKVTGTKILGEMNGNEEKKRNHYRPGSVAGCISVHQ